MFFWKYQSLCVPSFFFENGYLFYAFLEFFVMPPHPTPPHSDSDSHPCIQLYDGPAILRRIRCPGKRLHNPSSDT